MRQTLSTLIVLIALSLAVPSFAQSPLLDFDRDGIASYADGDVAFVYLATGNLTQEYVDLRYMGYGTCEGNPYCNAHYMMLIMDVVFLDHALFDIDENGDQVGYPDGYWIHQWTAFLEVFGGHENTTPQQELNIVQVLLAEMPPAPDCNACTAEDILPNLRRLTIPNIQ